MKKTIKNKQVKVDESELKTLDYFVKNVKKSQHKNALYIAFIKGLKRKMEE